MAEIESGKNKKAPYCTRLLEQAIMCERDTLIKTICNEEEKTQLENFVKKVLNIDDLKIFYRT
ncbi:MAG: hypothetical protein GY757_54760 [bacterium]|nr:hypothetical protein [bacterium]